MPIVISTDEKPTFVSKPDMRFANTFLSNKFRDYAVFGESLMDKATGEIYVKRPDGRTVSFFQNKHYLEDIAFRLNVMIRANQDFQYDRENLEGYCVSRDFDSMSIFNEKRLDILTTDIVFPNDEADATTNVKFYLSKNTNAFFIRPTTRDSDKNLVEFLSHEYNKMFERYVGDNTTYMEEAAKFDDIPKWKASNAGIEYTVKVTREDREKVYTVTDYIRVNEENCVYIPYNKIIVDFPTGWEKCLVTIKSITYYKIHFMVEHLNEFGEEFNNFYQAIQTFDHEVFIDYYNVTYFVDNAYDIELYGNEFIVYMIDVPFMIHYTTKLDSLLTTGPTILSTHRPRESEMPIGTIWAERVRDVYAGNEVIDRQSETNINRMEERLFRHNQVIGSFTTDPTDLDNFLLTSETGTYTREEVLGLINAMRNRFETSADHVVVRTDSIDPETAKSKVTDQGVILTTKFTTESED